MSARRGVLLLAAVLLLAVFLPGLTRQDTVLRFGVYVGSDWDAPYSDYYDMVDTAVARFEDEHPGVRVEYTSGIRQEDYSEWLASQALTGKMPDVFFVLDADFQRYLSIGALAELDGLLAADQDFDPEKYYPAAFEAGRMGDTLYALPIQSATTMMFYNRSLLEREGIQPPGHDWTWDDFYNICQRVTHSGQYGCYGYRWEYAVASNGTSVVDKAGTECYFDRPQVEEAVHFCRKLYRLGDGYQVTEQDFFDGRVAFRVMNLTDYRMMEYYPLGLLGQQNFEWGYLPMPAGPQGGNISCLETQVAAINARSKHKKLAWDLLCLLSYDPQVQSVLYEGSEGTAVLRINEWDQELYANAAAELRLNAELLDRVMDEAAELPKYETYRQTLAIANERLSFVLYGDADIPATLMALQREVQAYLRN